jgi:hypothetical protein
VNARLRRNALGNDVIGEFGTCEAYSIGKAGQKNINKTWKDNSKIHGEGLSLDISSIKGDNIVGSKVCELVVDVCNGYC